MSLDLPAGAGIVSVIGASDKYVELPWFRVLDSSAATGHSHWALPAGANALIDTANRRARFYYLSGNRFRGVEGLAVVDLRIRIPSWDVTWHRPGEPNISLGFDRNDDGDGHKLIADRIEGQETQLLQEFIRLTSDRWLCPLPCDLPDGRYSSNRAVDFDVGFGRNGKPPQLSPVKETVPTQPEFPYRSLVDVLRPIRFDNKFGHFEVPAGVYRGRIKSYNAGTGEVHEIYFDSDRDDFRIGSRQLIELMAAGHIELARVLEERLPSF